MRAITLITIGFSFFTLAGRAGAEVQQTSLHVNAPPIESGTHQVPNVLPPRPTPSIPEVPVIPPSVATGARFRIDDFAPPPPNQLGTGRCLYFASTGIAEWLYGRSRCQRGDVAGEGDFSEKYFYESNSATERPFTETPLAHRWTGYVPDREYRFDGRIADASPSRLQPRKFPPEFDRKVLFDYNRYTQSDPWAPSGRMQDGDVQKIKDALVQFKSPILFMYTPTRIENGKPEAIADYWHANYIVGWNEKGFIVRDSAFGAEDKSVPKDPTGQYRLAPTLMRYDFFKASGKSAAVYHLKKPPVCREARIRSGEKGITGTIPEMDPTKYPKADNDRKGSHDELNEYRPQ